MSVSLISRHDKDEVLDLLRKLVHIVILPHLDTPSREATMEVFAYLRAQRDPMQVGARFETVPELGLTRVTFEVGFKSLGREQ